MRKIDNLKTILEIRCQDKNRNEVKKNISSSSADNLYEKYLTNYKNNPNFNRLVAETKKLASKSEIIK